MVILINYKRLQVQENPQIRNADLKTPITKSGKL